MKSVEEIVQYLETELKEIDMSSNTKGHDYRTGAYDALKWLLNLIKEEREG